MSRDNIGRVAYCLGVLVTVGGLSGPVAAQPADADAERMQRRLELRQQLQAERGRWRSEGGGAPGAAGDGLRPPAEAGRGPARLSADERRELRRELRQAAP